MRKVKVTLLNILALLLTGIAFGLGSLSAMYRVADSSDSVGNFYQLVWAYGEPANFNVMNLVVFFVLCVAALLTLVNLVPFKGGRFTLLVNGVANLFAGIALFFVPNFYLSAFESAAELSYSLGGGLIAMAVLVIVAGVAQLLAGILDSRIKD